MVEGEKQRPRLSHETRGAGEPHMRVEDSGKPPARTAYYPNSSKTRERRNKTHRYTTRCHESISEIVNHLQEGLLDFQTASEQGRFPLHEAVAYGLLDSAKDLIDLGAELTLETPEGLTPLEVAVVAGNFDAAALLIQHGAPVDRIRDGMPLCWSPVEKKGF